MMKSVFILALIALWQFAGVTALSSCLGSPSQPSTDPRSYPRINNALKESARYHCYYKCHQNVEGCSKDAGRDLTTCETLLYWVYYTNYETCMHKCFNACNNEECKLYMDCETACLRIADDKVRTSPQTPDQLISTYFENRRSGRSGVYIGEQ